MSWPEDFRRAAMTVVFSAVTLLLVGCAIQPDSAPRDIPDDLLTPEVPSLSAEGGVAQGSDRIYLLAPDGTAQLRTVKRETNNDPTMLLSELISGPNPDEFEDGYRSAIPSDLELISVGVDAGVVEVDVNDALLDLSGGDLTLAVAQIVFTASDIPNAESVLIRVDGATQEWPDGSGSQHRGPLTTYDFIGYAESAQSPFPIAPTPTTAVPPSTTSTLAPTTVPPTTVAPTAAPPAPTTAVVPTTTSVPAG